jgi:hypothetical protein
MTRVEEVKISPFGERIFVTILAKLERENRPIGRL